jgi:hypothetical protein
LRGARRCAGFTLVELLLATGLAAVVLAATLSSAANLSQRQLEAEQLTLLHERANHAFSVLEPEIQMAGFGGLRPLAMLRWPASLPAAAMTCGTLDPANPTPLRIDPEAYMLTCRAAGGGALPGSDVLTIQRASGRTMRAHPGRVQLVSSRSATSVNAVLADGVLPASAALAPGAQELRDLNLVTFYLARDSDGAPGLPALRIKELTEVAGVAAMRDSEVIAGIEDLRIEQAWLDSADATTGVLTFERPGMTAGDRELIAVRVHLRLRSEKALRRPADQAFDYAGRQVTLHDGYLRSVVARTFTLRNSQTP